MNTANPTKAEAIYGWPLPAELSQAMTTAKRPPGRPPTPPEDRLLIGTIRLTQAQWAKLGALGGVDWLRKKIKDAKWP